MALHVAFRNDDSSKLITVAAKGKIMIKQNGCILLCESCVSSSDGKVKVQKSEHGSFPPTFQISLFQTESFAPIQRK